MSGRAELSGDMRITQAKLVSRYDSDSEAEVIGWIQELCGEEVAPGMRNVENALRNGVILLKLAQAVQKGTPNCPPAAAKMKLKVNTGNAPFKQMENLQTFVKFCGNYGMEKTGFFQTVDLYEGRNMAQVLNCLLQLGSECQRKEFSGSKIGPIPIVKNVRDFTPEKLRAGHGVVGLQAGTNKYATQKGMTIGGVRHGADIRADQLNKEGNTILTMQAATNRYASQKGMTAIGGVRHGADIRADDQDKQGATIITLQSGSNKWASQKGMTAVGAVRHAADIRADDLDKEGQTVIGGQAGSNKYATQKGMVFGGVRHVEDILSENIAPESHGEVVLQSGTNKFASQKGMVFGGVRHIGDIDGDVEMTRESQGEVGSQLGGFKGANQSGMRIGAVRHVSDIPVPDGDQGSQGVISLQAGTNTGENQSGMHFGSKRDVHGQYPAGY